MPDRKVNIQNAPTLIQKPDIRLVKSDFEATIWKHGYPVYHDKMLKCPCSGSSGQPNVTCRNCIGTGWILIERVQTRMILQSINLDTRFKEWSVERVGTVKITALDKDTLSWMDRVIVLQATTPFNEVLKIRKREIQTPNKFAYTCYDIVGIISLYMWVSDIVKLTKLVEGTDFTYERNKIIFSDLYDNNDDLRVTIKYWHNPQFHIIDIARDVINQDTWGNDPKEKITMNERFPIHATGRRSHYVLDSENYTGDLIIDNSEGQLEAGIPTILIPANPSYDPLTYSTLYINLNQLRDKLTEQHQKIVDLVGIEGTFILQDIDEAVSYTYVGYLKSTGEWLIKRLEGLGEGDLITLYANLSNNPTFTTYPLAWVGRGGLTYETIDQLIF